MAAPLGRRGHLRGRQRRPPPAVLRALHVPVPVGPGPQGHVRNYTFGDLLVRHRTMLGLRRALARSGSTRFGLPAENAAIKTGTHPRIFTDARIAELKAVADAARRRLRLAPRDPQPRPRVHPVEPGHLPAAAGGRPGLPGQRPGQLVPGLPDGAGQRAGAGRRHLRALGRPGGQARPRAVVLPDHRLRRRAPRRPRRPRVARAGQDHAAQLDRPVRRRRVRPGRSRVGTAPTADRWRCGSSPPGPTPASA